MDMFNVFDVYVLSDLLFSTYRFNYLSFVNVMYQINMPSRKRRISRKFSFGIHVVADLDHFRVKTVNLFLKATLLCSGLKDKQNI